MARHMGPSRSDQLRMWCCVWYAGSLSRRTGAGVPTRSGPFGQVRCWGDHAAVQVDNFWRKAPLRKLERESWAGGLSRYLPGVGAPWHSPMDHDRFGEAAPSTSPRQPLDVLDIQPSRALIAAIGTAETLASSVVPRSDDSSPRASCRRREGATPVSVDGGTDPGAWPSLVVVVRSQGARKTSTPLSNGVGWSGCQGSPPGPEVWHQGPSG